MANRKMQSSVVLGMLAMMAQANVSPLPAIDLRVEYVLLPVKGLQTRRPRYSWSLTQPQEVRGTTQSAYQAKLRQVLPDALIWDSGRVYSNATTGIRCGVDLESDSEYILSVQWWDQNGSPAAVANGSFSTALLSPVSDWTGSEWLTLPNGTADRRNQFRATLDLPTEVSVSRGSCFISGLGYHRSVFTSSLALSLRKANRSWWRYHHR